MKINQATVIDVLDATYIISRAGRKVGVTSIAKSLKITIPRARTKIHECVKLGFISPYSNDYRSNVKRSCYMPTPLGMDILDLVLRNGSRLI